MVEVNALKEALQPNTGLVCVMAVNNETGVLQPIQELAKVAHENGSLFFTDAVQAAPYMPINVKGWGVDMLSFSSHKFFGPKGCGVLYVKNGVKIEKFVGGGEQERGLRGGTTNVPSVVGFAAAYEANVATMSESNEHIVKISKVFMDKISHLDGIFVNGCGEKLPGVVNLRIEGVSNVDLLYKLDLQGVCVAVGSACASGSIDPSHVLIAMGLTEKQARECIRISFGKDNTQAEAEKAANIFIETVKKLREFQ